MIVIVIAGLVLIAILAVCLKRRHRRKVEEKRATLSGFAPPPSSSRGRTPEPHIGQDLWGPHQHMAHTRGWEYNHEQEDVAAGNLGVLSGDAEKRGSRKARRSKKKGMNPESRSARSVLQIRCLQSRAENPTGTRAKGSPRSRGRALLPRISSRRCKENCYWQEFLHITTHL